jgi:hypothetical protein
LISAGALEDYPLFLIAGLSVLIFHPLVHTRVDKVLNHPFFIPCSIHLASLQRMRATYDFSPAYL